MSIKRHPVTIGAVALESPYAEALLRCGTHARKFEGRGRGSVYPSSEWEQRQSIGQRQKEQREIGALARSSPGRPEEPEVREIGAGESKEDGRREG